MPQHDLDIANQSAPNFRADLNNALEALGTLSSGSTAPATTYANQLWYDTGNNILKMRTEADDGWIDLFNLSQGSGTATPTTPNVLDEDDFASNSATRPPSQQSAKAYVDGLAIGVGQTWQDVTASRSRDTVYQNTTGKPIAVAVTRRSQNSSVSLNVDGISIASGFDFDSSGTRDVNVFGIVPDGSTYSVGANGSLFNWAELR